MSGRRECRHGRGRSVEILVAVSAHIVELVCLVELFSHRVEVLSEVCDASSELVEYFVESLALALVGVLSGLADGGELCALRVVGYEVLELFGIDFAFFAEHRHLLGDVFELSDVTGPFVVEHELLGVVGESDLRQMVFVGHLHGEEAEEQQYVVAPFAQRRHLYGDGVESVEKVFAEASF